MFVGLCFVCKWCSSFEGFKKTMDYSHYDKGPSDGGLSLVGGWALDGGGRFSNGWEIIIGGGEIRMFHGT